MIKYAKKDVDLFFCTQPFSRIEIYENGDVFNCCPPFINYYSIGNIYKSSFDEIWNGEKVRDLRKKILSSDFSLCADNCNLKMNYECDSTEFSETVDSYPSEISISSDNICNVRCKICRDSQHGIKHDKEKLEEEIENLWLPVFKNAKILRFGCSGEPFASIKEMLIMKKAAEKYPDLKFHFHTNGILGNEKKLKELKVFDKIDIITLSLHSASRWTYNKIVLGGNWDKVMENIKLYSKMRQDNLIKQFRMIFVVYSENYKDMEKFANLAKKYNAVAEFWALRLVENTQIGQNFEKYSLLNENHKHHKDLIKILKKPVFESENVILYPELKKLREG